MNMLRAPFCVVFVKVLPAVYHIIPQKSSILFSGERAKNGGVSGEEIFCPFAWGRFRLPVRAERRNKIFFFLIWIFWGAREIRE